MTILTYTTLCEQGCSSSPGQFIGVPTSVKRAQHSSESTPSQLLRPPLHLQVLSLLTPSPPLYLPKDNGNNNNNRPRSPVPVTPQSRLNGTLKTCTLTLPRGCNSNRRHHCSPRPIPANCLRLVRQVRVCGILSHSLPSNLFLGGHAPDDFISIIVREYRARSLIAPSIIWR
jgi:hypothetical protein